jgi:hypothetical protein
MESITLIMPLPGVLSEMAWSIRGDVKGIFLPAPDARFGLRRPAPITIEDARVVWGPGLFHRTCIFVGSDDADRVLKLTSRVVVRCGNHGSI